MQRRSSLSLPTGRKSSAVDVNNINSPFGDSHRTPCPVSHVRTPRKTSKVLAKDGSLYHSQENVCISYIRKSSETNLFRPGHGLREPSASRERAVDASLMFSHPEPQQAVLSPLSTSWFPGVATPALFCHKVPAQGIQNPTGLFLPCPDSLWHTGALAHNI